jgi:hypothetical protein
MKPWSAIVLGAAVGLATVHFAGCAETPPIDENFDSSVGADFRAPADTTSDGGATTDAGPDAP